MQFFKKNPAVYTGLVLTLLFLFSWFFKVKFIDSVELKYYDARMQFRTVADSQDAIVIVDIDDDSIEKLGRWPWPRSLVSQSIDIIEKGKPGIIGLNLILSEREENSGLVELEHLKKTFKDSLSKFSGKAGAKFIKEIDNAKKRLDNDSKLEKSIKNAGNVIIPEFFKNSSIVADSPGKEMGEIFLSNTIPNVTIQPGMLCPEANELVLPIPKFLNAARGAGHINFAADIDGTVRKARLIYEYDGFYIPSYSLRIATEYLKIPLKDIYAEIGTGIFAKSLEIPVTKDTEYLLNFKGGRNSFKSYSFVDVIYNKVPARIFTNKIVLISPSAAGITSPLSTPTSTLMPVGEFSANTIKSILTNNSIREPIWDSTAEFFLILFSGLLIMFFFPRIKAMTAALSFIFLVIVILGGSSWLLIAKGMWLKTTYPLLLLVTGYISIVSIQYFMTETGKEKIEGESAETNRMLGVSFQEQGMLDMAFDKFRRVPLNDQMMDILHTLAQDFERKRQFTKAVSVYEHMETYDKKFKDISERRKKLVQATDTMVFGDGLFSGSSEDSFELAGAGTGARPTLGRYEILKKLGKGAMGTVYLGQDPRINRTTAIKTMKFSEEFSPEDAEKMSETFFREAESAGTLSHPNIVTIYDAGNEHDVAFIAMEYLEGTDMDQFVKKENLLPMRKIIDYVADIADGLSYAHHKGIVHRDIKPANIMLLKNDTVKITDFGIARITATSQTMTGVIKGTPHYMSPEQFSGEKVDGRSDIFSLGTMLFRLLTGELPFQGSNPASLMHNIISTPHPDPRKFNPKIYKPLITIINKALRKDKSKRYQDASVMAEHLRTLGKKVDAVMDKKAKTS